LAKKSVFPNILKLIYFPANLIFSVPEQAGHRAHTVPLDTPLLSTKKK
jgi:hypothetical protein